MSVLQVVEQSSSPATPASGYGLIYFKTDGLAYAKNDAGTESQLVGQMPKAIFNETQTNGTNGGTFTSGADRTRTLNTTIKNTITGCSLASNQITLPAGTYEICAFAPANYVNRHRAKLYNVTDSTTEIKGTNAYCAGDVTTLSVIIGEITIAAQKVFEIRHRTDTTYATYGFGVAASFSEDEIYTVIEIKKIG